MEYLGYIIALGIVSYLLGSVSTSILLSRAVSGKDIRESGSGNAGATNVLRTMGKGYAALTLVGDVLKGVIAVLLGKLLMRLGAPSYAMYIAGVCAVVGHNFPAFFGFRGGKGVAASLGVVMTIDWQIGLIVLGFALLIMALTRYVSLGSVTAAVLYAALEIFDMCKSGFDTVRLVCVIVLCVLLVIRHHANIKRLMNGTENRLGAGGKGDKSE